MDRKQSTHLRSALLILTGSILLAVITGMGSGGSGEGPQEVSLSIRDQGQGSTPFFITGENSTTSLLATALFTIPSGSMMPYSGGDFIWITPGGREIARTWRKFQYLGSNTFRAVAEIEVNLTTFPPNLQPYALKVAAGDWEVSEHFHICGDSSTLMDEDFSSSQVGSLPSEWQIEEPGYSPNAQWVEELTFEGRNKVLRMTSYVDRPAVLNRSLNISCSHLSFSFKARLEEETRSNDERFTAMSVELVGQAPFQLLCLGRSDKREELHFGRPYEQGEWTRFTVYLDLDPVLSSCSVYMNDQRLGSRSLPGLRPEDLTALRFSLGSGAHYVAQLDDIRLAQLQLDAGNRAHPARLSLNVKPIHGQWFDPSSIMVNWTVEVTPCQEGNPYIQVDGFRTELWNSTARMGILNTMSWNDTPTCNSPCQVISHPKSLTIDPHLIDRFNHSDFSGDYILRCLPADPSLSLLNQSLSFHVDDPMKIHFSRWPGGPPVSPAVFPKPANVSVNVELDPRGRSGNGTHTFGDKSCHMSWIHPDGTVAENQTHYMSTGLAYPSERAWVFGTLKVRKDFPTGVHSCLVSVKCDSGYEIVERREFRVNQVAYNLIPFFILLWARKKID